MDPGQALRTFRDDNFKQLSLLFRPTSP